MAITKALPQVWSGAIKAALLDAHVFGAAGVVNRDYEGDVADYGVSVKVISLNPVAIKAYTKNATIAVPDVLTDAETILTIDQAQYFNFSVDDIDQAQTRPKLFGEATRLAAWGLRDVSDTYIAAQMKAGGTSTIANVTGLTATPGKAYDALVDLSAKFNTLNVPTDGRFAICDPSFYAVILKDDRFLHATAVGDAILANGVVGRAAGFTLMVSNNMPAGGVGPPQRYCVIAGTSIGYSFVEQLLRTEAYRPDGLFADALKGLYVYGGKTMYPEAVGGFEWSLT
jgi:hypothetical protein